MIGMLSKIIAFCEDRGLPKEGWRPTASVPATPLQIFDRYEGEERTNVAYVSTPWERIKVYDLSSLAVIAEGYL